MKVIVQIPCLNEEKTLPLVVNSIPRKIPGVDRVEIMIIDDGSTDRTVAIAKKLGVDHIVRFKNNRGLAKAFAAGINRCMKLGADIVVNTDADNQYPQHDIPRLIEPILKNRADIVIANRQTSTIKHFSFLKKFFQWFGSATLRVLTRSTIPDAVSGFRAYSKAAIMQLNIVTDFSYVIETIISAQSKRIAIESIDVVTNPPTRKSRLFSNMFEHMRRSGGTIIRIYTMFRPLLVFTTVGIIILGIGVLFAIRFIYFVSIGHGAGHVQSLILSALLIMVGFQIGMTGLVADMIAINRKLSEDTLRRMKLIEYKQS
jgi:glycosyltransferase involved in cell wall biosynthesis